MSRHIENDGTTVAESSYGVLPEGTKVLATVCPTKKDTSYIEERKYAKEGPNANIDALAVRFRISDGQRGAGRNVFARGAGIPLVRTFASGKPAHDFFGFFRALGYDVDAPEGFDVPEDRDMLGQEIELVLGVELDNKGEERNYPKFYNKPNGIPVNVSAPAAKAKAAWHPGTATSTAPGTASNVQAKAAWSPPGADRAAEFQQAADASQGF